MVNRWWGPTSGYRWEQDALDYLRAKMAECGEPYRAWQTFTFTAASGQVREVDLLMATPAGLYLVEIKSHPGRATNDGPVWTFRGDKVRTIENPLHLTDLKAKELKGRLKWAAQQLGVRNLKIPFVEPAVFLADPALRCDFDDVQREHVYGRDEACDQTGLDGIWRDLLGRRPRTPRLDARVSKKLDDLLHKIGVAGLHSPGKIGPFELTKRLDVGPGWEDWWAENPAMPDDEPRRARVYVTSRGASPDERAQIHRAADREYRSLRGVAHEGIVRADFFSEELDLGPAVVFRHGRQWRRLDLFMAELATSGRAGELLPLDTRVEMVRQLAEAVDHAHRRNLYHRSLSARSVWVEMDGRYPRLRIADWQTARYRSLTHPTAETSTSATSLYNRVERAAGPYLAPEFATADADAAELDIFGLGALTFLLLTGRPPADDRAGLARRIRDEGMLVPSAVDDDMTASMDDLVRGATRRSPADRFETVREFLQWLDLVEEELTRPDDVADPLEAKAGTDINGWRVTRVLGKGSTSRALLVTADGHERVLKVALSDDAGARLDHEAQQLTALNESHDAHIVRLLDGPLRIGGRMVLATEYVGDRTLAQRLRHDGPLPSGDLEKLGEDLLVAVEHLETVGVWHRDIKPDNLAVRELPKRGRRLMLFDFSLAGTESLSAGTPQYLDPFLGSGDRTTYDAAAELYAAAVTLHEMASGELPTWGEGNPDPRMVDDDTPQLSEDLFDAALRDGLARFFRRALHRDARERFPGAREMRLAWTRLFHALDVPPPAPAAGDGAEVDVDQVLKAQADRARLDTPLTDAGLSARAVSVAERQLGASTVGDLMEIPGERIRRLRGVGLATKNELTRQASAWRDRLRRAERPDTAGAAVADPKQLRVDELVDLLLPAPDGRNDADLRILRIALALPAADGARPPLLPWAAQREVGTVAGGVAQPHVAAVLGAARQRWKRLGAPLKALRDEVCAILGDHGRLMSAGQVAAELLVRRGAALEDSEQRRDYAHAAVRAAFEAEQAMMNPRLVHRRLGRGASSRPGERGTRVLLALCSTEDDPDQPNELDLLDYGERLGRRADALVKAARAEAAPLPGTTDVRTALRAVPRDAEETIAALSDTDLVRLAAAASETAAVTERLELYPRDLDLPRALRLAQVGAMFAREVVVAAEKVRDRVRARFPELTGVDELADRARLRGLLRDLGLQVEYEKGLDAERRIIEGLRLDVPVTAVTTTRRSRVTGDVLVPGQDPAGDTESRLATAADLGGFRALKVYPDLAPPAARLVAGRPGVTAVNVTAEFVRLLREVVDEFGKPRWEVVLKADDPGAGPAARVGFAKRVEEVWRRLEARVRDTAQTPGSVTFLHDAAPLTRYTGGLDLLARLADAARRPDTSPWGLWVLCPMTHPGGDAALDGQPVGVYGPEEQFTVPPDAVTAAMSHRERTAS